MTTVLAVIDTGEPAGPVLQTAAAIARLFDATTTALYIRESDTGAARQQADAGEVELCEAEGPAVPAIVAATSAPDVVAVVVAARGLQGVEPPGYTTLDVITQVPKPVVVVPPRACEPTRLVRVLVALDGTPESSRALTETIALADRNNLEILILHVHSPDSVPAFSDHAHHATRAWEEEFISRFVPPTRDRVGLVRRVGDPADDVASVAHDIDADLIALGWSQNLAPGRAQVVRETLAHSNVPVLLVPTPPRQAAVTQPPASSPAA